MMTHIRHILPGYGRIPANLEAASMSGIVSVAYYLARQQSELGNNTELVGLTRGDIEVSKVKSGLQTVPIKPWNWLKSGVYDFRYYAPLALKMWRSATVDMQHVHDNPYHLALGRARKRVLHCHSQLRRAPSAYQRAVLRADAVVCSSAFIRSQFLRHVDYPEQWVFNVPNGVDLAAFRPASRQLARSRFDIPSDDKVILFVGQINPFKGLLYLVMACQRLASKYRLRLLVAGSSKLWGTMDEAPVTSEYERQVIEAAGGLTMTFLGNVSRTELPSVYQAADIFVCPSIGDEGFGIVNLEAMATALPVIASQVGGIVEVVTNNITGLLVPPADDRALAVAIRELLDSPSLQYQMGNNGLKKARSYGWAAITNKIMEIYALTNADCTQSKTS